MKDFYNSPTNEIYNQDKFGLQTESLLVDDQINTEILKTSLQTIGRKIQGEKFLEIGPGRGVLLKVAQDLGFKVYGNELNDALSESLISQFGDAIEACEVQESCYPDNHFDVIYLRDVIEHITDPRFFLDELNRILKIDGSLVICTHNIHGLIHKMVGKRHPVVFGFEHPIHWSPASLRNGLKNSGFTTEQTLYEWDFKKVQNRLSDFTLNSILAYWLIPSFSSIQPFNKKLRISRALLYRLLTNRIFGLQNPVLSRIERAIGHGLCRATRRPSYFAVIAKKITI
jgi:SAM-dependent methyltransferase